MAVMTVQQVVQNLRGVLQKLDKQTNADAPLGDSTTKRPTSDWIQTAETTRKAAKKTTPELHKLEQFEIALRYRTAQITQEPKVDLSTVTTFFKKLSDKLFPSGISDEFTKRQLRHLCENYPTLAQKLLEPNHEDLNEEFYRFCLQAPSQSSHREKRTEHWVDIYAQYPEVVEYLMKSSLFEKLGYFPEHLWVDSDKGCVCIAMDLFETKGTKLVRINLSDKSKEVVLRNPLDDTKEGKPLSLEELSKKFETDSPPDIDLSTRGIINLNSTLFQTLEGKTKIVPLDPKKWTDYRPYIRLTWAELKKLYPEVKDDFEAGFVLGANSFTPKSDQAFFDLLIKSDSGNYRVYSFYGQLKPGARALYQQKRVFCPISREQGQLAINKVSLEIERCQKAQGTGKPIPSIDVQSFIDEILGHPFYAKIEGMIDKYFIVKNENTELKNKLTQARQNLDHAAIEEVLKPVFDKLIAKRDFDQIHQFIAASLTIIYSLIHDPSLPPKLDDVVEAAKDDLNLAQMPSSLVALGSLCFEALHPYRMTVTAAEKETRIIGLLFRFADSIPWGWLKNILRNVLLKSLGRFRGYHYKTLVSGSYSFWPERYLNRPSQLFESFSTESKAELMKRVKECVTVLSKPVVAAVASPPHVPAQNLDDSILDGAHTLYQSVIEPPDGTI